MECYNYLTNAVRLCLGYEQMEIKNSLENGDGNTEPLRLRHQSQLLNLGARQVVWTGAGAVGAAVTLWKIPGLLESLFPVLDITNPELLVVNVTELGLYLAPTVKGLAAAGGVVLGLVSLTYVHRAYVAHGEEKTFKVLASNVNVSLEIDDLNSFGEEDDEVNNELQVIQSEKKDDNYGAL